MTNQSSLFKVEVEIYKQLCDDAAQISGIGIWAYRLDDKEFIFFDNFYRILGLDAAAGFSAIDDLLDFVADDHRQKLESWHQQILDGLTPEDISFRINRHDGTTGYIRGRCKMYTGQEAAATIVCTLQDVGEKKVQGELMHANERLYLQNQTFNQTEEIASLGSWQLNLETGKISYSDNLYRLYGLSPDSEKDHEVDFLSFVHPDDKETFRNALDALFSTTTTFDIRYRITRNDGALRYLRQRCRRFANSEGADFIIGSLQDFTEQEIASQELTNHEAILRDAEKMNATGSWERNLHTHELIWSDELYRIYGFEPGAVSPDTEFFIHNVVHPEDIHIGMALVEKTYKGDTTPFIFRIVRPGGETRTVKAIPSISFDSMNNAMKVIGVVKDITDEAAMLDRLRQASRQLGMRNQINSYAEEIAGMGTWWWYPDTGIMAYSDNMYRLLGLEPQAIAPDKNTLPSFIHPADKGQIDENISNMSLEPAMARKAEFRIVRADGAIRYMRNRGRRITEDGVRIYLGTMQDITDEVRLRQEIADRIQFTESLVENNIDRIMVLDAEMRFILWNRKCEELYSLSKNDVIGKHYGAVFPDEYGGFMKEYLERVLKGETVGLNFIPGLHAWGYHDMFAMPLYYGNENAIMIIMHDVTEQILLRKDLMVQRRYAEMLVDASVDRIMAIDTDMYITAWNKTCEMTSGIKKEEVIGKKLFERFPMIEENKALADAVDRALKGTYVFLPAQDGVLAKGSFENYFIPLRDENKAVKGVLNIMHDVTHTIKVENELKQLNNSLVKKNRELQHKNAELASFSYIASHDLKEPLRKIYTFAEMIVTREAGNLSSDGNMYFKRIQASVQRMGWLIDDILAFTQLNTHKLQPAEVDLNGILMLVKNNLMDVIQQRQATIDAAGLPIIRGYRNLLSQLFQNMISNALKFQAKGNIPGISITAATIDGNEINHPDAIAGVSYVMISFKDNGIGFEERYKEHIFQMFKKLHNSELYPGTGIGLAICKKIAEMHNGFITASSVQQQGSTFNCYLQADLRS